MRRRFSYALTAGVLSSGAPAGLLGVRLAKSRADKVSLREVQSELKSDRHAYLYIGGATALIFALFGYLLGRKADSLAQLSETDPLTGLLNARGFSTYLDAEVKRAKRYRHPLSLLFLDLDGLKAINDRYGHRSGSEALLQVAGVIRAELRQSDLGARWGGDEFTIVAPNTTNNAAMLFAERLRARIAEHRTGWHLTASIGVATLGNNGNVMLEDATSLLRNADAAMYRAKWAGKNTVANAFEQASDR